jgi:cytochrome c
MRKMFTRLALVALALFVSAALLPAHAGGTPEQAKALAEKAAALVSADGAKAFSEINNPHGAFVQGDLYVVVVDSKGVIRANAILPKLIGVNMWDAKDPDGDLITQKLIKEADSDGTGWVMIKFTNPATKKIEPKKTWVHKVGDYVVFCGAYMQG